MALIETHLPGEVLCAAEGEKLPAGAALVLNSPGMEPCRARPALTCCALLVTSPYSPNRKRSCRQALPLS